MALEGFERGARLLFSFPSVRTLALGVVVASTLALAVGCNPAYVAYTVIVPPLLLKVLVSRYTTLRRALGLIPFFLAWGTAFHLILGPSSLVLAPPSLFLLLPTRFVAGSRVGCVAVVVTTLIAMALTGASVTEIVFALSTATVLIVASEVFTLLMERKLRPWGGMRLFYSYLNFILAGDAEPLERALSNALRRRAVPIFVLDLLDEQGMWGMIAIPHVHPGPFRSLGSSRLPALIASRASKRGVKCVVLHGASTHGEDLVSHREAERLAELIVSGSGTVVCEGSEFGVGVEEWEGFRATAFALEGGTTIAVVERLDGGLEDIPFTLSARLGESVILVDAHNSYDNPRPSPREGDALGEALLQCVVRAMSRAIQQRAGGWLVGIASHNFPWRAEIGSAGVSLVTLNNGPQRITVAAFDSNNALKSFRDRLYAWSGDCRLVVTTTDTHELTGARAGGTYSPLGTRFDVERAFALIAELSASAHGSTRPLKYRLRKIAFESLYLDIEQVSELSRQIKELLPLALLLVSGFVALFVLTFIGKALHIL